MNNFIIQLTNKHLTTNILSNDIDKDVGDGKHSSC